MPSAFHHEFITVVLNLSRYVSKRCPNCAAEVSEDANFCSNCGHSISQEEGQKAQPQRNEWSFSNPLQISSTSPLLSAASGSGDSRSVLETWSGLAAIGAGIVAVATAAGIALTLTVVWGDSRIWLLALCTLFLAIALPGFHTRQARLSGRLGRTGFILAMIGVVTSTALFAFWGVLESFPTAGPREGFSTAGPSRREWQWAILLGAH